MGTRGGDSSYSDSWGLRERERRKKNDGMATERSSLLVFTHDVQGLLAAVASLPGKVCCSGRLIHAQGILVNCCGKERGKEGERKRERGEREREERERRGRESCI